MHIYIINWRVVHRQYLCNYLLSTPNLLVGWNKCHIGPRDDGYRQRRKSWVACGTTCLTWLWHVHCTHTSMTKITTPSENCSIWHTLSPIHILHLTVNVSWKSWVACGTTCAWHGRGMSAVLTLPWRKSLHHWKTAVRDIHSVPYTFFIWL